MSRSSTLPNCFVLCSNSVSDFALICSFYAPAQKQCIIWPAHTHTRPFNVPLSGTTWISRYEKGKTNLDFTEARDSEWQWHQLFISWAICKSVPCCRQITMPAPHHSVFYRPDALHATQPTVSKH